MDNLGYRDTVSPNLSEGDESNSLQDSQESVESIRSIDDQVQVLELKKFLQVCLLEVDNIIASDSTKLMSLNALISMKLKSKDPMKRKNNASSKKKIIKNI